MTHTFERNSFGKRFGSMLRVDFKRLLRSRTFYIFVASCLLAPILILVMTAMMDGQVSVDPQTGKETVMEGFDSVWQIIGSVSTTESTGAAMDMSLTSMCNINMLCFAFAAFVCIFVAEDFRSGYAKNLFTVRAKKTDYVASKTLVLFTATAIMTVAFLIGAILGGIFGSVPFTMEGFGAFELVTCMLAKITINLALVALFLIAASIAKSKMWLSILLSMAACMLIFNVIPAVAPLDATPIHVAVCLGCGLLASFGFGAISNLILKKTSLV